MKKIVIKDKINKFDENVACIGYFDGLHKGHQALISKTIELAKKNNVKSMLVCFDPDPSDIINASSIQHILTFKDRLKIMEGLGLDIVCVIKFDESLMKQSPKLFIQEYLLKMNIKTLVCGYDFSFGYKGLGDSKLLSKYLETIVIDKVEYYGKKISSSRIREEFYKGNFKLVNNLLGYNYVLSLKVVSCIQDKNKYLVECKTNDSRLMLPKDGKYSLGFEVKDKKVYLKGTYPLNKNEQVILVFENE